MKWNLLIPAVLYELIIIFGVGFYIKHKQKATADVEGNFALARKDMNVLAVGVSLAVTVLGAAHVLGSLEMTYGMGAIAIWFSLAHVLLIVVSCFGVGVWVKRLGVTTVPEAMKGMFGGMVAGMVSCVLSGICWGILTLETQGLGVIIFVITGWPIVAGCVLGGVLGIFYVILAGMEEVGTINILNAVVMYAGLIIAVVVVAFKLPGGNFETVREFYNGTHGPQSEPFNISIFGTKELFINFAILQVITVVFGQGINQILMQACMSAKNEETVKRAVWIAAPVNGLFATFIIVIGLTAKADPEYFAMGGKAYGMAYIADRIPATVAIFVLASLMATILSTFAMTTLTPATMFAIDIYKKYFNKNASERSIASVIRIMIVVLGIFAIAISTFLPNIMGAINWLFAWAVPVFWLFVTGLFWKRSKTVAVAALVITWIANMIWTFVIQNPALNIAGDNFILNLPNGYVTLILGLLIIVAGNIMVGENAEPPYFNIPEVERKTLEG